MAKVLVTGGAGFIGSHIADSFLQAGHEVLVLDDLSSGSTANISKGVAFTQVDIRSALAKDAIIEFAPDVLVHAAAQISVSESMKMPDVDASVNVLGLVNILQGLSALPEKPYIVFISTGGAIYGEQDYFPADEAHPMRPESFYGLSKRVGEMYLDLWERSFGIPYGVVRLSNVYGPRQNPHGEAGVIAIFNSLLLDDKTPTIYGDGEQTRDYIFVADVVSAVVALSEKRVSGVFNIGTGVETSVNELYAGVMKATAKDIKAQHAEGRAGEQRRSSITAAQAQEVLSWAPKVPLAQGLQLTADWFQAQRGV